MKIKSGLTLVALMLSCTLTRAQSSVPSDSDADYAAKLSQRRISEYSVNGRALFSNAVDVEYGLQHGSSDSSIETSRSISNTLTLRSGLSERVSSSLGFSSERRQSTDIFSSEPFNSGRKNIQGSLSYLLMGETPSLPQLYAGLNVSERLDQRTQRGVGVSLSAFRTLESVTLNASLAYDRLRSHLMQTAFADVDQHTVSAGGGLVLTLNHRAALSFGLNVSRAHAQNTLTVSQMGLTYRFTPLWVGRVGFSRQESGGQYSSIVINAIRTVNP